VSEEHPALAKLRQLIATLPETSEKLSHGAPTFWGGKKTFATFTVNHHGDGRVAVWVKSTFEEQSILVESAPETFFVPPYVGPSGWVGMRLDGKKVDWSAVRDLLEEGWRMVAPKRAIKAYDES
jgi:phosphoribosylglycinamide formyltransferase-1/phosphoribosylamine--glycine ligase/phosphoribosylglycinamide formyltransferase/phosphoribosylformylglycinamidine cyclo-ligase